MIIKVKDIIKEVDVTGGKYNPLNPYASEPSDPTRVIKNLGGDDAGSAEARSEYLRDKIEQNFSKLGIPAYDLRSYMKIQGIYTEELLKSYTQPFDFSFMKENGEKFSGKATYNKELSKQNNTIVLNFNNGSIIFSQDSIKRPFLAKKGFWAKYKEKLSLRGLQTNSIFDVKIIGNISNTNQEGGDKKGSENYKVGDKVNFKTNDGKLGSGTISKIDGDNYVIDDGKGGEITIKKSNITSKIDISTKKEDNKQIGLYNDLAGFFKFIFNSNKKLQNKINTVESIIDDISKSLLITEQDEQSTPIEKIKILKIGILGDLYPKEDDSDTSGGSVDKIPTDEYVKCKAELKFKEEDDGFFNKQLKKQIQHSTQIQMTSDICQSMGNKYKLKH